MTKRIDHYLNHTNIHFNTKKGYLKQHITASNHY